MNVFSFMNGLSVCVAGSRKCSPLFCPHWRSMFSALHFHKGTRSLQRKIRRQNSNMGTSSVECCNGCTESNLPPAKSADGNHNPGRAPESITAPHRIFLFYHEAPRGQAQRGEADRLGFGMRKQIYSADERLAVFLSRAI